ncbi:translation initiation factor IF-2 [Striga asiatica]|uniref:Translation initiation factor IF-2 n=1 Tax=Striga asiatica TaxID=4170 RepID=A0A5A7R2N1_STRAF|nr:translation initiation factor IF-2 [Striga asiatica]
MAKATMKMPTYWYSVKRNDVAPVAFRIWLPKISVCKQNKKTIITFGDGRLDVSALANYGKIVDAFLLRDERFGKPTFPIGEVGFAVGKFHLGHQQPLKEGESYADNGTNWDENFGAQIWEQRTLAHYFCFLERHRYAHPNLLGPVDARRALVYESLVRRMLACGWLVRQALVCVVHFGRCGILAGLYGSSLSGASPCVLLVIEQPTKAEHPTTIGRPTLLQHDPRPPVTPSLHPTSSQCPSRWPATPARVQSPLAETSVFPAPRHRYP